MEYVYELLHFSLYRLNYKRTASTHRLGWGHHFHFYFNRRPESIYFVAHNVRWGAYVSRRGSQHATGNLFRNFLVIPKFFLLFEPNFLQKFYFSPILLHWYKSVSPHVNFVVALLRNMQRIITPFEILHCRNIVPHYFPSLYSRFISKRFTSVNSWRESSLTRTCAFYTKNPSSTIVYCQSFGLIKVCYSPKMEVQYCHPQSCGSKLWIYYWINYKSLERISGNWQPFRVALK